MSNTVRRAVFLEIKHHVHTGISTKDLAIITNSEIGDVIDALDYFKENDIIEDKVTTQGVKWYVHY